MNRWLFSAAFCASLMLLASCGKQQGQPQVAGPADNAPPAPQEVKGDTASPKQEVKADTNPSLQIESRQELPLGTGTKATIWNLRGRKVKELTARLLVCIDGKKDTRNEINCVWGDTSEPIHGQLIFLVQDGQPFGGKGKRLPSLSLSFQSGGPSVQGQVETSASALIPSGLSSRHSQTADAGSISGKRVLYVEFPTTRKGGEQSHTVSTSGNELVYKDKVGELSLNLGTGGGLVEFSKDGGVALAVVVEWKQ